MCWVIWTTSENWTACLEKSSWRYDSLKANKPQTLNEVLQNEVVIALAQPAFHIDQRDCPDNLLTQRHFPA